MCREELKKMYTKFCTDFPIVTIEDPFDQDDWDHTAAFTAEGVCQVLPAQLSFRPNHLSAEPAMRMPNVAA
jgi:enolase